MGQPNRTDLQPPPDAPPPGEPRGPVPPDGGPRRAVDQHGRPTPPGPPHISRRRRLLTWIFFAAIVGLAILLYLRYFGKPAPPPAKTGPPPASITAARSAAGSMNIYIQALGTVTPLNTITVFSQITGRVMTVYYNEGQMVRKGDPLVEIDPRPYQANLTQAQGNLQHDEGLLAQAQMDLARYQAAWARNAIARQQLEDQEHLVVQYQGTVKADRAAVDFAQIQLSYCHIVAPIGGRVGLRLVDPGNTVFAGSGSTLVVITQLQPITVVFSVPEDDLQQVQAQLRTGRTLTVDAFDRSNQSLVDHGALTSLDNQVDTTTGTVRFRGHFPNPGLRLFPNQFVNARLLLRTLRNTTIVPTVAIQHNGDVTFVYLVKPDNTVAVQNVTVLTGNETNSAVSGLNRGVEIATSGFDRLENGVPVAVRPEAGSSAQAAPAAGAPRKSGPSRHK